MIDMHAYTLHVTSNYFPWHINIRGFVPCMHGLYKLKSLIFRMEWHGRMMKVDDVGRCTDVFNSNWNHLNK